MSDHSSRPNAVFIVAANVGWGEIGCHGGHPDALVWTKGPFLLRDEPVAADDLDERRPARRDDLKRPGDHPTVIRGRMGGATTEAAAGGDDGELLRAPYRTPVDATVVPASTLTGSAASSEGP